METTEREGRASGAGRIIVVRHGRPALDREAGPKLDWRAYRDWWRQYELGSLREGQECPEELRRHAHAETLVFSSLRPRAMETAAKIAAGRPVTSNAVFNEAPLPPPRWSEQRRYLPKTWNKFARLAWLVGHRDEEEDVAETRRRAKRAATMLIEAAETGRDVVLAAHGWFNRMLRRPLAKAGWICVHDGGDAYWSFRIYEKRS